MMLAIGLFKLCFAPKTMAFSAQAQDENQELVQLIVSFFPCSKGWLVFSGFRSLMTKLLRPQVRETDFKNRLLCSNRTTMHWQ